MRLQPDAAISRLGSHDHGVLCTLHPTDGIDAVPVAYALEAGHVAVPVDTVKAKSTLRLGRERNVRADPRATLLVEHYDGADWSRLWWVRARLQFDAEPPAELVELLTAALADRYAQYRDRPFATVLVLRVVEVSGWAAEAG